MFHLYCVFYVHVTVHRNKILFNKTNRRTKFPNLFCQETLHVSVSSSAHHQEFSTVHSALVCVRQVWWQLSSTTRMELVLSCSWWVFTHLQRTRVRISAVGDLQTTGTKCDPTVTVVVGRFCYTCMTWRSGGLTAHNIILIYLKHVYYSIQM